jgi:long-chain acyl-CoA synthetase
MAARSTNLVELLSRSCESFAARPLFGTKLEGNKPEGTWSWITYGEFRRQVDDCRGALSLLGVVGGDKIAIVSNNRVEWAVVAYAAYGLGAAVVPMYEAQLAHEREFIVADCGAKIAFVANQSIGATLRASRPRLPTLETVVEFDGPPQTVSSFAALIERGRAVPAPVVSLTEDVMAVLIYTSGTTGTPKGVKLSHGNLASNVGALGEVFPFDPDDRSLSFLPWAHAFGLAELNVLLSMGSSLALNRDVKTLIADLVEVKPTILVAVPSVFDRIYRAVQDQLAQQPRLVRALVAAAIRAATKGSDVDGAGARRSVLDALAVRLADRLVFSKVRARFGGRLKYAVSGGATLGLEVARFMEAVGIRVYEGYGLTETSPIVTANSREHRRLGSVGRVVPGVRVVIDTSAATDGDGEIVVYGPNVMLGYHDRPAENAAAMRPDGGFRTGDLGRFDDDGYLYLTGRIKEQFKLQNGKYVAPSPLEEALKLSRYIANVLVYGENRPYPVALVALDAEPVGRWAEEKHVKLVDPTNDERVRALIEAEIRERSAAFKEYERTRAFALVDDFSTENGLLTPTLKLKRARAISKYADVLASLYDPAAGRDPARPRNGS